MQDFDRRAVGRTLSHLGACATRGTARATASPRVFVLPQSVDISATSPTAPRSSLPLLSLILVALIQGITEFLPISSSGHLIFVPSLLGWDDQGLAFDIAVHLGTLTAVVVYFRRDLVSMARSLLVAGSPDGRLAWQLIFASVPLAIAGYLTKDVVETTLRTPWVIAASALASVSRTAAPAPMK